MISASEILEQAGLHPAEACLASQGNEITRLGLEEDRLAHSTSQLRFVPEDELFFLPMSFQVVRPSRIAAAPPAPVASTETHTL